MGNNFSPVTVPELAMVVVVMICEFHSLQRKLFGVSLVPRWGPKFQLVSKLSLLFNTKYSIKHWTTHTPTTSKSLNHIHFVLGQMLMDLFVVTLKNGYLWRSARRRLHSGSFHYRNALKCQKRKIWAGSRILSKLSARRPLKKRTALRTKHKINQSHTNIAINL